MKNKGYSKFGGQISCTMGDVQVANNFFFYKGAKARRGKPRDCYPILNSLVHDDKISQI